MSPTKALPKFTRGEKCIFVHLTITFTIILILIIIYFTHLWLVKHRGNEIFRVSRRSYHNNQNLFSSLKPKYQLVGAVYLKVTPPKIVCNSLLLRQQWSLAPAHCVSIFSDPDMAHLIPFWKVMYKFRDFDFKETKIKRNIVHSNFNRDDFSNNIGLFEHYEIILFDEYDVLSQVIKSSEKMSRWHGKNIKIVDWDYDVSLRKKNFNSVRPVSIQKCHDYALPVVEQLRNYEFCVNLTPRKETFINHGAVVFVGWDIIGIFSWGDKNGYEFPLVILNVLYYSDWLRNIINVNVSSIMYQT